MEHKYKIIDLTIVEKADRINVDLTLSYSLDEAYSIVRDMRANGQLAELYPGEYSSPKISESHAWEITCEEFEKIRNLHPENYGEMNCDNSNPTYYRFYCRDFRKETEGMTPGNYTIMIDKLDGHILSKEEFREYRKLNYSF